VTLTAEVFAINPNQTVKDVIELWYVMAKLPKFEKLVTIGRSEHFKELFKKFLINPLRSAIVVDSMGKLQGVVFRRDILKAFVATAE